MVKKRSEIKFACVISEEMLLVIWVEELPPVGTLVHIKSENRGVRIWRVESIRLEVGESGFGEYVVMVRKIRGSSSPTQKAG
jgi:hypothetical protein